MKYIILFFLPFFVFADIPAVFQGPINTYKILYNGEIKDSSVNLGFVGSNYVQTEGEKYYIVSSEQSGNTFLVKLTSGAEVVFSVQEGYRVIGVEYDGELVLFAY